MKQTMLEEYRFLRQELDMNRKFIFERPLIIVGATLAASVSLSGKGGLEMLPLPFLAVLYFNLWFTFNRLRSSARIVAYLQLVHEGERGLEWIGWENALRRYRTWMYWHRKELKRDKNTDQDDGMAYYPAVFPFHVLLGLVVTAIVVSQSPAFPNPMKLPSQYKDNIWLWVNYFSLIVFLSASFWYRPGKITHSIESSRQVWAKIMEGTRIS